MIYVDRRVLTAGEEQLLIELGYKLSFKYSYSKGLNLFEIYVVI